MADLSVSAHGDRTDRRPVLAFGSTVAIVFDECGAQAYSLACRLLNGDPLRAEAVVQTVFVQIVPDLCRREDVAEVDISEIVLRSVRQQCIELIRKSKGFVSNVRTSAGRPETEESRWRKLPLPSTCH